MLSHGTSDDNVHILNTMRFVEELIRNQVQFNLQIYPGEWLMMFDHEIGHECDCNFTFSA